MNRKKYVTDNRKNVEYIILQRSKLIENIENLKEKQEQLSEERTEYFEENGKFTLIERENEGQINSCIALFF